jgi:hypothetical protein
VENGHPWSQSGATGGVTSNIIKTRGLMKKGRAGGGGINSTSTSKDYLCLSSNVNFAGFSLGVYERISDKQVEERDATLAASLRK